MAEGDRTGLGRGGVLAIAAIVSLAIGWAVSGDLLYHSLIGLDASGFPFGEWIQRSLTPGATRAVGGLVIAVLVLVSLGCIFFVFGRLATRPESDGRRAFLAGTATAATAFGAGLAGALAHALFGVGKRGDGWWPVQSRINSDDGIVKTHPRWEEAWRGARVRAWGRLGRTG